MRQFNANEIVRKAMITLKQSFQSECPFLTQLASRGHISIHFRPQGDPRVTWERDFKVPYKNKEPMTMNPFSRECDPDNRDLALEVIEYTLFQYISPDRKVLSGKIQFMFEDGIISDILASGSLIYEDCK